MLQIKDIISDAPPIHQGETEMPGGYSVTPLSSFSAQQQESLAANAVACWGLGEEALHYIYEHVHKGDHTLEIGSGISTLTFGIKEANHICITPSEREIRTIKAYAAQKAIQLKNHTFINQFSEEALPALRVEHPLDLILIDGKHAFPWPFIDWFYSVVHLKQNGILLVDDTQLLSGKILCDFMKNDPNWEYLTTLDGRTQVFRKTAEDIRNVAWHMQPFIVDHYEAMRRARKKKASLMTKVYAKLASFKNGFLKKT
jgi:predicted O-methyltransferase YrrM